MYTIEQMDGSRHKRERRRILHELVVRQKSLLATDYPGPIGRDFIRQLHRDRPDLEITLVNKSRFVKDVAGDSLEDVVKKMRGDIFDIMQEHPARIVDVDLFGGLSLDHWKKIETAPAWRMLFLTFTNIFRHQSKKGLLKRGEDPAGFMELWCQEAGWRPPVMPQLPYQRPNKNAIMGVVDHRGPKYHTFLIRR